MVQIDLSGRVILLTGALGGIARFVVDRLLQAGASMVLTDIVDDAEAARALAERGWPSDRCSYRRMDVTSAEEVEATIAALFDEYPAIETVLGHAGGTDLQPFANSDAASFDRIVRYNFLSQTYLARSVLKRWRERRTAGHMIFTTSWVGTVPWPQIAAYNASKAALNMFARTLALEYAEDRIRFNLVAPGIVGVGKAKAVYDDNAAYRATTDRISPLGRLGDPAAVADAILFLCSDLGRDLDGHILNADAGLSLTKLT